MRLVYELVGYTEGPGGVWIELDVKGRPDLEGATLHIADKREARSLIEPLQHLADLDEAIDEQSIGTGREARQ